jgi:hypothetical protein
VSLERWRHRRTGILHWAIYVHASGQVIGYCQLAFIDPATPALQAGHTIGEKPHRGFRWSESHLTEKSPEQFPLPVQLRGVFVIGLNRTYLRPKQLAEGHEKLALRVRYD